MLKFFLAWPILALLGLLGLSLVTEQPPRAVTIYRQVHDSVVLFKNYKGSPHEVVGTGFVVDGNGDVLTCGHVIARALRLRAELPGGKEVTPQVLGSEDATDLVLIRLPGAETLKPLPFASRRPEVGENVLTVGHPYGFPWSLSGGIVSGLGRDIEMGSVHFKGNLIQVTVPINPGNSGGPLLNERGEVVGVVMAIRNDSQGMGFAVDAQTAQRAVRQLWWP